MIDGLNWPFFHCPALFIALKVYWWATVWYANTFGTACSGLTAIMLGSLWSQCNKVEQRKGIRMWTAGRDKFIFLMWKSRLFLAGAHRSGKIAEGSSLKDIPCWYQDWGYECPNPNRYCMDSLQPPGQSSCFICVQLLKDDSLCSDKVKFFSAQQPHTRSKIYIYIYKISN